MKSLVCLSLFAVTTIFAHNDHDHFHESLEVSKWDLKKSAPQVKLTLADVSFATDDNGKPLLNSLPGAAGAIYLDVEGGPWSSTANGLAPYGGDFVFDEQEQMEIYRFWQDVSNHFAMFDINVTTVAPDKSQVPTAHILISPTLPGGVSQTNVYGRTEPFARSRCNSQLVINRSTCITHEIGHNLGLNHQAVFDEDGNRITSFRGADEWNRAPYMGVDFLGVYSHWANNTATGANEPVIQDDIARIAQKIVAKAVEFSAGSYTGDGFRPDDFDDDVNGAFSVSLKEGGVDENKYILTYQGEGIIERYDDVDIFAFEWFGGVFQVRLEAVKNVSASPTYASSVGLNLKLLDASGNVLVSDFAQDPADVDAEVSQHLESGKYLFEVSGAGQEADLGRYSINITAETSISDAYREWITSFANIVVGENEHYLDDFDGDSKTNLEEFALGLNPTIADQGQRIYFSETEENGALFFRISIPIRKNADFEGVRSKVAVIDGIRYEVQGSKDLLTFEEEVLLENQTSPELAFPALPDQWEYRHFKVTLQNQAFLRVLFGGAND